MAKSRTSRKVFYSMGEVSEMFDVNPSLIRFWEKKFDVLRPKKNAKGNRLFTPEDVENLKIIYHLVKERGMTLSGAEKYMKDSKVQIKHDVGVVEILQRMRSMLVEIRNELDSEAKHAANEIIIRPGPAETDEPDAMTVEAIQESSIEEEILQEAEIEKSGNFMEVSPQEPTVSREEERRIAEEFADMKAPEPYAKQEDIQEHSPIKSPATPQVTADGFQMQEQSDGHKTPPLTDMGELPLSAAPQHEDEEQAIPEAKPRYVELSLFDF